MALMFIIPVFVLVFTFVITFMLVKWWIGRVTSKSINLVGKDMNKYSKAFVAEIGGLPTLIGFILGLLIYVGYRTFIKYDAGSNLYILSGLLVVVLGGVMGLVDDLLGWKIGLKQWQKPILGLFIALPLAMVYFNRGFVDIPFFGNIDFGLFYPLILIPVLVTGFSNGFNLLGGYNGLEGGMATIILVSLGFVSWVHGFNNIAMISFVMVASLLAFLFFNWYPAKIFPGNTFSYSVGTLIAVVAILGNLEILALFLYLPYFLDLFLLFRAKSSKVEAFAKPNKDNSLELPYAKCYDTTHLSLKFLHIFKEKVYEYEVVSLILIFEFILAIIGMVIWL